MRRAMEDRWYFTKEQISNTASVRCGYSADRELSCRQQAANFMQDMGQRLQVTQLCINTAIVYMHRFYMFHSFTQFHRTAISAAALFLAAKVEEQPRKLEHVIKVAYMCLHREQSQHLDTKSEQYLELAQDLVVNENVLLQTLGFDVAIDHPHTHVVQCCSLVKASRDLAQTSYFMASNSLHLTTMCLQYRPTLVACFCIHLAMKWSNWQIPESSEGKPWFWYVDQTVTQDALEQLTAEFLVIFEKCPSRLKRKIMAMSTNQNPALLANYGGSSLEDKKHKEVTSNSVSQPSTSSTSQRPHHVMIDESKQKMLDPMTLAPRTQHNYKKLIPQHGHHGHGHRDQKTHGHPQPNAASIPPKKNVNRPPDCMYPPPIRISDHNRQSKTEQQAQHYKMSQHAGGHGMQQMIDLKQQSQSQSSFLPNAHHAPPPVPHSQKNKYEVPLQQQSQQPPLPPATISPPLPPPPPVQPPPTLPHLPSSSRHLDMTSIGNATGYNNVIKQEITEQNHRYDNSSNSGLSATAPIATIKQEPNHNIFSKPDLSTSVSALSNRLNIEQNNSNSNRFNVSDNLVTNNISSSNSSLFNINIKQEPISSATASSSLLEQNHHHSHNYHQQHSHHSSSHHRHYENNVNNNCNGGSGGRNQIELESEQYQHNSIDQQNHSKYDNGASGNSEFLKRSPVYEHGNHYQQTNDSRTAITDTVVKKESGLSANSVYEHGGRLPTAPSKHQQAQSQHISKTCASNNLPVPKPVKAPSIFSPEKDPLPPVSQVIPSQQQQSNNSQVNKLKRKRLSSSGSETEVMVPLIKKLQQEEIARYEPSRSHGASKTDKINANQLSVPANPSLVDGNWNIGSGTVKDDTEPDMSRPSSLSVSAAANHTIETEVGATIEITDHFNDKKHKDGRERKKKKKHKEHKEHKDRERHRHKEKHKSKEKNKDSMSSIKSGTATDTAISIHYMDSGGGGSISRSNNSPASNYSASIERSSLKIKIPKEKLVKVMPSLKVKFSKEMLQGMGKSNQDDSSSQSGSSVHQRTGGTKISMSASRHHDPTR